MKLLRSLLRIAATVCICMAIIVGVTIAVRPRVLDDWPGDYAADVRLPADVTPVMLARADSRSLPVNVAAAVESNDRRPVTGANSDWVLADPQPAPAAKPDAESTVDEQRSPEIDSFNVAIPAGSVNDDFHLEINASPAALVDDEVANPQASSDSAESARDAWISLPEFLRGRELPPLAEGEKVVTVQVPVDNWVDLETGAFVRVSSEMHGKGVNSDAEVHGMIQLAELERVEIYALPRIAPEDSATVSVALKVNAPQARLLFKLRASKHPLRLTLVESGDPAEDAYSASSPTPSATRLPLRSEDDFLDPTPARKPQANGGDFRLPDVEPTPADDPIVPVTVVPATPQSADPFVPPTANRAEPAAIRAPPRSEDDFADPTPARKPQASGDPFRLPEAEPTPVGDPIVPVTVVPATPQIGNDFAPPTANRPTPVPQSRRPSDDPTPIATAETEPAPSRGNEFVRRQVREEIGERLRIEQEQSLPAIEPSEAGTVIPVQEGTIVGLQAGQAVIVEDKNEGAIKRVSGFDATLIRVTALSRFRVKIEGLKAGETVLTITIPNVYRQPLRIPVTVEQPTGLYLHTTENTGLRVNHFLLDSPGAEVRKATDSVAALKDSGEYSLVEGSTLQLETSQPIVSVDGHDQSTIGVTHLGPQRLRIGALQGGESTLQVKLKGSEDDPPITATIRVKNKSHAELERLLHKLYPAANVTVESVRESVLLRGSVASESELLEIGEIAGQYAAKVLNQLRVKSAPVPDDDVQTRKQPEKTHTVHLTLPGNRGSTLSPRQMVDVIEQRVVRNQSGREESMERKIAENVEVADVHIGSGQVLVQLRVTEEIAYRLGDIDHFSLQIVPHGAETYEAPSATQQPPTATYQVPAEEPVSSAESITLSKECRVAITSAGKLDVAGCAKCHSDRTQLNLQLKSAEDPLRDDIHALHDDVRKLITLLERRAAASPPSEGFQRPRPPSAGTPSNAVEPAVPVEAPEATEVPEVLESPEVPETLEVPAAGTPSNAVEPAKPAAPPEAPETPEPPPKSMTDAKRPDGVDRETAAFLERTWWLVGIRFTPLAENAPQLRDRFVRGGLLVDEVRPESPVAKAKIEVGDVIIGVRKWETLDEQDFGYAIEDSVEAGVWDVQFHYVRDGRRLSTQVAFEMSELESPPHGTAAIDDARRQPDDTAETSVRGLTPTAATRQKQINEIGRVLLRRDYPRALELADAYRISDPDTGFAALKRLGPENVPVVVVATAQWSAPCRQLQPLLRKLQNSGYGMVMLDVDNPADAELVKQLEIESLPTLAWAVDGRKSGELVGVFSESQFERFFEPLGEEIRELLEKMESGAGVPQPDSANVPHAGKQRRVLPSRRSGVPNIVSQDLEGFPDRVWDRIGLRFTPVGPNSKLGRDRADWTGLRVDEIHPHSSATQARIKVGDIIVGAQQREVSSAQNLQWVLNHSLAKGVRMIEVVLQRNSERLMVPVEVKDNQSLLRQGLKVAIPAWPAFAESSIDSTATVLDPAPETSRQLHAVDFDRTFQFSVGFAR